MRFGLEVQARELCQHVSSAPIVDRSSTPLRSLPQELVNLEHPDPVVLLHPQQIAVVRDDRLGTRVDGAFDDFVVLGIGLHDIKLDFRHAPHRATSLPALPAFLP